MRPGKLIPLFCAALACLLTGCGEKASVKPGQTLQQRYDAAKALFEKASRDFHIPSAAARGTERARLEEHAAALYKDVASRYSDQPIWAAQALRSLANIRASQTNAAEAVKLYGEVADRFPGQDFEVLMAWKSAGDLLSDSGKPVEAKRFYEKLVARFDKPDALPIVQAVVRGAKARMAGELLLTGNGE